MPDSPKIVSKEALLAMVGEEMPPSEWFEIDQRRIDLFADATEDHQYIHIDPERAAQTPFGGTIAHGFLTLSLLPHLSAGGSIVPENLAMTINYGMNRLRFMNPVKTGSRVRLRAKIKEVSPIGRKRILVTAENKIEIEGATKPALVAETLMLHILNPVDS